MYIRVTDEQILETLEKNDWNLEKSAEILGFTRPWNLEHRINANDALKAEFRAHNPKQPRRNHTDQEYLDAIIEARGNRGIVAKLLGLKPNSVYARLANNQELYDACYFAREELKDIAETKLFELVEQGDFQAIKFYLNSQGKDRGYGEKLELTADVSLAPKYDLSRLSSEEMLKLEELLIKALPEKTNQSFDKWHEYSIDGNFEDEDNE
jgi:hypothetical protein